MAKRKKVQTTIYKTYT